MGKGDMTDDVSSAVAKIESELTVTGFSVSASVKGNGRESWVNMSISTPIPLAGASLPILVACRKVARIAAADAVAKGILTPQQKKELCSAQEENYDILFSGLVGKQHG